MSLIILIVSSDLKYYFYNEVCIILLLLGNELYFLFDFLVFSLLIMYGFGLFHWIFFLISLHLILPVRIHLRIIYKYLPTCTHSFYLLNATFSALCRFLWYLLWYLHCIHLCILEDSWLLNQQRIWSHFHSFSSGNLFWRFF